MDHIYLLFINLNQEQLNFIQRINTRFEIYPWAALSQK